MLSLCIQLLHPTRVNPNPPSLLPQLPCLPKGGKGGPGFLHCPLTVDRAEAFREICPAGHGYTYSSSDIRLSMRKAEEEELARPSWEHVQKSHGTPPGPADRQPLRAATGTWLEAGTIPDKGIWAGEDAWESPPPGWGGVTAPQRSPGWHPSRGALGKGDWSNSAPGTCSHGLAGGSSLTSSFSRMGSRGTHVPGSCW